MDSLKSKPAFQLLEEVKRTGIVYDMEGNPSPFEDQIDHESYLSLYQIIRSIKPGMSLELGFAHACSTLYMLQSLADNGAGMLISVDSLGLTHYKGCGLKNVERSGLQNFHKYINGASQIVLPQLLVQQFKCDFVFIDTSHQFDQTIMECYYCDKLLKVGGIMAFHDYRLLSVKSACNFVESNLNYRLHPSHSDNLRVIQKVGHDNRVWHYFVPFEVPKGNQSLEFEK